MAKKKKPELDIMKAVAIAVDHAIVEMNERKQHVCAYVFAVKDELNVMMIKLSGIPDEADTKDLVTRGLKKGSYVVFVVAVIENDGDMVNVAAFDKNHEQHAYISPCKIENGKVVQVPKVSRTGFQSFLDD